jgi:radical SAM protein with 4Fe4S-binding SPASM domain
MNLVYKNDHVGVYQQLQNIKVQYVQLDLFGFCNAACWYCPVKYIPQPERTRVHMPLDLVEKILIDLNENRISDDGVVSDTMRNIYTAHYGEVLLYKHFEGFLDLLRKYNFTTTIFSNGVNLTPNKIDMIKSNRDVISDIVLNIPSFEPNIWANRSGLPVNQYDRLISNLEYLDAELADFDSIIILINGVDDTTWNKQFQPGEEFDQLMIDQHPVRGEQFQAYKFAKRKFKNFITYKEYVLHDRAGLLSNLITNQPSLEESLKTGTVVGCRGGPSRERVRSDGSEDAETDRTTEMIHINPLGETFLCCNDYTMEYVFGNLSKQSLSEIWVTEKHAEVIVRAREEICRKCHYAEIG